MDSAFRAVGLEFEQKLTKWCEEKQIEYMSKSKVVVILLCCGFCYHNSMYNCVIKVTRHRLIILCISVCVCACVYCMSECYRWK